MTDAADSLAGMTKAQLLDYAEAQGVSVNSRMNKAAIIEAIEEGTDGNTD